MPGQGVAFRCLIAEDPQTGPERENPKWSESLRLAQQGKATLDWQSEWAG
jgi:hypothetical protein